MPSRVATRWAILGKKKAAQSDPFDDHRKTSSTTEEGFTLTWRCSYADHIVES
jgi:hypothetical protein